MWRNSKAVDVRAFSFSHRIQLCTGRNFAVQRRFSFRIYVPVVSVVRKKP
jgi:hypothetical protein